MEKISNSQCNLVLLINKFEQNYPIYKKIKDKQKYLKENYSGFFLAKITSQQINEINDYLNSIFLKRCFSDSCDYNKYPRSVSDDVLFDNFFTYVFNSNLEKKINFHFYCGVIIPKTDKGINLLESVQKITNTNFDSRNILNGGFEWLLLNIKDPFVLTGCTFFINKALYSNLSYGIHENKFLVETPPHLLQETINIIQKNLNYINENKNILLTEYQKALEKFEQNFEGSKQKFYEMLKNDKNN